MLSFEEAGTILDEAADALPEEIFQGLNGGISLLPRLVTDDDGFCIMGQYIVDSMGRRVEIYYGSFEDVHAEDPDDVVASELRKTLYHELTHHLENRAGDRSLELWDAAYKMAALEDAEAEARNTPPRERALCRIVHARKEHLPEMARLERLCFSDPWPERTLAENLTDGCRKLCLAALEGGELRGYILLQYVLDEAEISNVAVDPDEQCRGIGGQLVSAAANMCRKMGIRLIHLEVRESNEPARRLYTRQGFEIAGRRKRYYRFPKEDAILMTKRLEA